MSEDERRRILKSRGWDDDIVNSVIEGKRMTEQNQQKDEILSTAFPQKCPPTDAERIEVVVSNLLETLLSKNKNYGSSVYTRSALAPELSIDSAIRVRMSDKIQRLKTMFDSIDALEVDESIVGSLDESIEDSMLDLAGYAILWLARPGKSE